MQPGQTEIDYKQKYKALKRKLRFLIYEQESFVDELRKAQRKMLKVARDRSFLLDRLLQYEKPDESSSDSDATASSDSEAEARDGPPKRKKLHAFRQLPMVNENTAALLGHLPYSVALSQQAMSSSSNVSAAPTTSELLASQLSALRAANLPDQANPGPGQPPRKRPKTAKKGSKSDKSRSQGKRPHGESSLFVDPMSREEIERHLDSKKPIMNIEKAGASLPLDIFSNDNSNQDRLVSRIK
ncbi:INO80 complex subunit E-like isoform X2 [Lineus longissimus]|uniref:INO80 complex subunit E-like isoform X2 n=1 Tax=Lineus longissimus TaxID=88925 RepID=UPI00315C8324